MRDPKERLRDILDGIANIERYAARGRKPLNLTSSFRTGSCGTCRLSAKQYAGCRKNSVIGKNPYPGLKSWVCEAVLAGFDIFNSFIIPAFFKRINRRTSHELVLRSRVS